MFDRRRRRAPVSPVPIPLIALALLLGACSGAPPGDPYADPGTPPPPAIDEPTLAPSGTVSAKPGSSDLIQVSVAGIADPKGGAPVTSLDRNAFTVVEDGVVQGITVDRLGVSSTAIGRADIAFVVDTTLSMATALESVQESITSFADLLTRRGYDVRFAAVTFGDAFDTRASDGSRGTSLGDLGPPAFDPEERPTFDFSTAVDGFKAFITADSPREGGDLPENSLGALAFAFDRLAWRPDAQRLLVVITDVCSHTAAAPGPITSPWTPGTPADVLARLRGKATVHVVAPDSPCNDPLELNMKEFAGAGGTGGVFVNWDGYSAFDLSTLPIADVASSGYLLTYRGTVNASSHSVRVVIDDGKELRGEFTATATY